MTLYFIQPNDYSNILLNSSIETFLFSKVTCAFRAAAKLHFYHTTYQIIDSFFLLQHFLCIVVKHIVRNRQHTVLSKLCLCCFSSHLQNIFLFYFDIVCFNQLFLNQVPSQFFNALIIVFSNIFFSLFLRCSAT